MSEKITIESVNRKWAEIQQTFRQNADELRESLDITAEQSVVKLEEAEDALRKVWNISHMGFKLVGFKVEVKQTVTMYPVGVWLMFTPEDDQEPGWELSTRFGGVVGDLIEWIYGTVGVDRGIQLELKIPMFHEV
ncbi:hypothetical protein [Glutamicibacter ardleyensis]|uniref:hypothetical protein n=1 Tax=Glutamicibacter ardleyensis TaxID=225894 RepID=UPI003FD60CFF